MQFQLASSKAYTLFCSIHFTASQYYMLRFDINLLIVPTTQAMCGFVHSMAYVKLPIVEAYETLATLAMKSFSSSICGQCFLYNLKWLIVRGVLTTLASLMLNLSNTLWMYLAWDNYKVLICLSLLILIPSIWFTIPKSFNSN